jgi:hypothetical protein
MASTTLRGSSALARVLRSAGVFILIVNRSDGPRAGLAIIVTCDND